MSDIEYSVITSDVIKSFDCTCMHTVQLSSEAIKNRNHINWRTFNMHGTEAYDIIPQAVYDGDKR